MLTGHLALTVAALFTGAAFYINVAEQPARLALDNRALLAEWKLAYKRGFAMQASLAVLAFLLALATWWSTADWRWIAGGVVILGNWPFTLLAIMPTNVTLIGTPLDAAGAETRALVRKWGARHAVRTGLGALSILIFVWTLN